MDEQAEAYHEHVRARIEALLPVFGRAAIGDFSQIVEIPDDPEFASLYEGINILVEVAQSRMEELQKTNKAMETQMNATVTALETTRKLEERLTEQAVRLHAIVSSMGEGLLVVDGGSRITLVNGAAEQILSMRAQDLVGKNFHDIIKVYRQDRPLPDKEKPITRTLREDVTTIADFKDGLYWEIASKDRFPVALVSTPVQLVGETHAIVVFRNVTEEKNIDRAKSEFVSLASHQLRSPLTTIKWYVKALLDAEDGSLTADQTRDLEVIHSVNSRLIDLVDALLDVSRIELGTLAIVPEPVNIIDVCKGVVQSAGAEIQKKNLSIQEHYDAALPLINLDPQLTGLILQNLLTNAMKYTPERGQIFLRIDKQESEFVITVQDSGIGIPREQQSRIFSKFFRADNARALDAIGNGLGLYMTKEIVGRLGGTMSFISKVNEGTTFMVRLPLSGMPEQKGRTRLNIPGQDVGGLEAGK